MLLTRVAPLLLVTSPPPRVNHIAMSLPEITVSPMSFEVCCARAAARARARTHTPSSRAQDADAKHGVSSWGKWGCEASTFDWTYSGTETAYVLTGKVKVVPTGKWASCKTVEVKAGDLCVFPDGMTCRWEVTEAIDKHFNFS